jgi:PKD repeat protein
VGDNYALTFAGAVFTIISTNTAPVANPGGPYLGAINTAISFDGSASSDPQGDLLTYAWTFGDITTGTGATPDHSYTATGVYDVCLTVNDGALDSSPACTLAVVYDPSAGFVTGSGWINSPEGAYRPDPSLTGQATFGLLSKYKKGATVPTGTTQFQFSVAGFSFYSETYEFLVVNQGGTTAQFKGSGLINGEADPNGNAYKFMLWAFDGKSTNSPDTFRIRIWWEDASGEHDVYDNNTEQAIGTGNIVVHTGK